MYTDLKKTVCKGGRPLLQTTRKGVRLAGLLPLLAALSCLITNPATAGGYAYGDPVFDVGKNACRMALFGETSPAWDRKYLLKIDRAGGRRLNFCECVGDMYVDQGGGLKAEMEQANTAGEYADARKEFLVNGLDICLRSISVSDDINVNASANGRRGKVIDLNDANDFGEHDKSRSDDPDPLPGDTIFRITESLSWNRETHARMCVAIFDETTSQNVLGSETGSRWFTPGGLEQPVLCSCVAETIHNNQEAMETVAFSDDSNHAYVNALAITAIACEQRLQ